MPAIKTMSLSSAAQRITPGGAAKIRELLKFPSGELTHVLVPPGKVALPASVKPSAEWFYIVAERGSIWCGVQDREIELRPGRTLHIPAGTPFQYSSDGTFLEFLLAAMTEWHPTTIRCLAKEKGSQLRHDRTEPAMRASHPLGKPRFATMISPLNLLMWLQTVGLPPVLLTP